MEAAEASLHFLFEAVDVASRSLARSCVPALAQPRLSRRRRSSCSCCLAAVVGGLDEKAISSFGPGIKVPTDFVIQGCIVFDKIGHCQTSSRVTIRRRRKKLVFVPP